MALKYSVLLLCVLLAGSQLVQCKSHKQKPHKERGLFSDLVIGGVAKGHGIIAGIVDKGKEFANGIVDNTQDVINKQVDKQQEVFGGIIDTTQGVISGLINTAQNVVKSVISGVENITANVVSNVLSILTKLADSLVKGTVKRAADALKVINNLGRMGQEFLQHQLKDLLNTSNETGKSFIDKVIDSLEKELQARAKELGLEEGNKCVATKNEELKQLATKGADDLRACITDKYEEAANIVNSKIDSIEQLLTVAQEVASKPGSADIEKLKAIASNVLDDVKQAAEVAVSAKSDLKACAKPKIEKLDVDRAKILDSLAECVPAQ